MLFAVRAFLVLGLLVSSVRISSAETVKRVVDGDTIELSGGKTVHLIGIDAPENTANDRAKAIAQNSDMDIKDIIARGKEAERFLRSLIEGKEVRLEFDADREDKKGNLLAYVFAVKGAIDKKKVLIPYGLEIFDSGEIFINATMVKSGYASPLAIPPNVKHSQLFKQLSIEAVKNRRGLWK